MYLVLLGRCVPGTVRSYLLPVQLLKRHPSNRLGAGPDDAKPIKVGG